MDITADLSAPCAPEELFRWVSDLDRYPRWLEIVTKAEPIDEGSWAVDLRGRLGPLARTKRLRMVRTTIDAPNRVVFERSEVDGREHSAWRLTAEVRAEGGGSHLAMGLHYGGSLFAPVVGRVLTDEIERSRHRLLALVSPSSE